MESKLEITCGNCDRPWLDRGERWRSYLDDEGNANVFCLIARVGSSITTRTPRSTIGLE